MRHYDKWGDVLPELKQAIGKEIEKIIPEKRFKPGFKTLCNKWTFEGWAEDVIKTIPENITLTVVDGNISFDKREETRDNFSALADDSLAALTKPKGPDNLQELLESGVKQSGYYKSFLE